jgi:4'-phosphopantetheinyl transferase
MPAPLDARFPFVHRNGGVSVHRIDLRPDAAAEARCLALLDAAERTRAERFKFAAPRRQFVLARGALRLLLGSRLGRPAQALTFAQGPHGKPYLVLDGAASPVQFNVSHSDGRGLIALADAPVGVDIEFLGRAADLDLVAKGVLTAAEQAVLQRRTGAARSLLFYRLWTQKEALIKAKGVGFACPPRGFAVPDALLAGARCARFAFPGETRTWLITDLSKGAYAAALAQAAP